MSKKSLSAKVVVVGDGACGKTCFLEVFKKNNFPETYVPTVVDNFYKTVTSSNGEQINLALWDTAGQEDYDTIRPLSYKDTDLVLLCYTVSNKKNLSNIPKKWLVEIKNHAPNAKYFLVALKKDLREDPDIDREKIVEKEDGEAMAEQIKALEFFEVSALKRDGVDDVFISVADYIADRGQPAEDITRAGCCACLFGGA